MCLRGAGFSCYVHTHPLQVLEEEEEEEDVGEAGNKYDKANDLVNYQEIYQKTNIWRGTCHYGGSYE